MSVLASGPNTREGIVRVSSWWNLPLFLADIQSQKIRPFNLKKFHKKKTLLQAEKKNLVLNACMLREIKCG